MRHPQLTPEQIEKNRARVNSATAELAERRNYLNVAEPFRHEGSHGFTTLAALRVAREINEILADLPNTGENHQASVSVSRGGLVIFIGGECVYDSDCHTPDEDAGEELTAAWCIEQYKAAIWAAMCPFAEVKKFVPVAGNTGAAH